MALETSHYDFEDFVEFVGWEAFDVLCAGIKVSSEVSENSEVSIDGGCVTFEDFKISLVGGQSKMNTLVISDCVVEDGLNS